jgi:hypothetical protein
MAPVTHIGWISFRADARECFPMAHRQLRTRPRHLAADQADVRDGVVGARKGRVVTTAVRLPVRLATRWMRVVSRASGRVIAGRMVVSRCASLDLPAPGGPSSRTLGSQRLHPLQPRHVPVERSRQGGLNWKGP